MNWRIYRLPGSRAMWHIDAGCGTPVFNVRGYNAAESKSVDIGGNNVPRAWIEISGQEFHIINGWAYFEFPGVVDSIRESVEIAAGHSVPPYSEFDKLGAS
jgi:hypothetical protein